MPAPFTQAQLDAFWARYVTMRQGQVIAITNSHSAAYEPDFDAMLGYVFVNRLYGFADYTKPAAGSNMFPGGGDGWIGPQKEVQKS
jgi:hypothetical protein